MSPSDLKSPPRVFRLAIFVVVLALSTALAGCFVGGRFGGGLPAIAYIADNAAGAQVWVSEPDGGGETATRISAPDADARFPRWSPGQRFLAWVDAGGASPRLMLYDAETGETAALASGIDAAQPPVWAPETDGIAYVSDADGDPDIYMASVASGQSNRLTFSPERERIGDWSPDGEWLVFTESGRDGLLLRNPNGVNRIALTGGADSDPVWSPKGDRIAFLRRTDDGRDIYLLRPTKSGDWADDTDEEAVADTGDDEFGPAWSPDGRRLVFVAWLDDGQTEIFTVRVDGSQRRRLTHNTVDDLMPAWSQSGDKIAFVSHAYGNAEILYMNADGAEQRRLTTGAGEDTQPDW